MNHDFDIQETVDNAHLKSIMLARMKEFIDEVESTKSIELDPQTTQTVQALTLKGDK